MNGGDGEGEKTFKSRVVIYPVHLAITSEIDSFRFHRLRLRPSVRRLYKILPWRLSVRFRNGTGHTGTAAVVYDCCMLFLNV